MVRTRYWWPFTQSFYSICSAHYIPEDDCEICNCGTWHSDFFHAVGKYFHDNHYELWYWWVNSYIGGWKFRKFMHRNFPNSRPKK